MASLEWELRMEYAQQRNPRQDIKDYQNLTPAEQRRKVDLVKKEIQNSKYDHVTIFAADVKTYGYNRALERLDSTVMYEIAYAELFEERYPQVMKEVILKEQYYNEQIRFYEKQDLIPYEGRRHDGNGLAIEEQFPDFETWKKKG